MTATTQIIIDRREDVLRAPDQALRYSPEGQATSSGGAKVWVLRDGAPRPVDITPGLDDDSFTEVIKGDLRPGDEVIIGEEAKTRR